jgi:uncharacterized protein YndB with AHSA1/START domain
MTEKPVAKASITINATASQVWEALTDPDLIEQYLFGTHVTTDWQVGSPIHYRGVWEGKPYEDKGQIVQIEPEKLLVSTYWSPLSGVPDLPAYYKTVRYELTPAGRATRVTITQDNNDTEEEMAQSSSNWEMVLGGMKKLLEGEG